MEDNSYSMSIGLEYFDDGLGDEDSHSVNISYWDSEMNSETEIEGEYAGKDLSTCLNGAVKDLVKNLTEYKASLESEEKDDEEDVVPYEEYLQVKEENERLEHRIQALQERLMNQNKKEKLPYWLDSDYKKENSLFGDFSALFDLLK